MDHIQIQFNNKKENQKENWQKYTNRHLVKEDIQMAHNVQYHLPHCFSGKCKLNSQQYVISHQPDLQKLKVRQYFGL